MDADGHEVVQERLLDRLAERSRTDSAQRRQELDGEISELAASLGLEPEELESLTPEVVQAERQPSELVGRFRVHRLAREIMPFWVGLIIGGIVIGLAGPVPGGAIIALVVIAWFLRSQRRIAVFDIDELGNTEFRNWGPLDWADVEEVSYHLRYPWLTAKSRRNFVVSTAIVRIRSRSRRTLRLAQGTMFQTKPKRQALPYSKLSTFLKKQAKAAGMKVQRTDEGKSGWRATRTV